MTRKYEGLDRIQLGSLRIFLKSVPSENVSDIQRRTGFVYCHVLRILRDMEKHGLVKMEKGAGYHKRAYRVTLTFKGKVLKRLL